MLIQNDYVPFVILPIESLVVNKDLLKSTAKDGYDIFLAEARKRFLIDELIKKNNLSTVGLRGEIIELDNGSSKLTSVLHGRGIKAVTLGAESVEEGRNYGIGVSHNQLEKFNSLESTENAVNVLESASMFGMVHQVWASDDPGAELTQKNKIQITGAEWENFFKTWCAQHSKEGWNYLGSHRGAPHRPRNYILERNGSFPFYKHYDKQLTRRMIAELTVANGISAARIPLLVSAFALAKDNPYLLSAMIGVIHSLDAADGAVARKGFGNSPLGPMTDILSDHFVETYIMFKYAHDLNLIPKQVPWAILSRDISTDILRLINAFKEDFNQQSSHPHKAFGTKTEKFDVRFLYEAVKTFTDMVIPVAPRLGIYASGVHVGASIARAIPVWTSPTSQNIYKELLEKMHKAKSK